MARIRRNTWQVVLIAAALCALSCGIPARGATTWSEPPGNLLTTGPYILLGKPGQAFIAFRARLSAPPRVEWWVGDGARTEVVATRSDDLWIVSLEGLPIGDKISYQVVASVGTTPPAQFRVGIDKDKTFRFIAFGDTRTGHDIHRAIIEAASRENVEFLIHTGDMVERGGTRSQWDTFFQIERPLLRKMPIIPAIGNHDMGARGYYRRYFLHRMWAKNLRYYHHDWGNLRVVAMDGGIECREGCTQYGYVESALREGAERGMFMVMFLHYPPFSSGAHGSHKGVQEPIRDLARRHGVEIVFSGHDHDYERSKAIDGTVYVVSGSAGAPIKPVRPRWFTAHARTEPHYVLVDVESDNLVIRAVNLKGETFDSYVVPPNPPHK